MPKDRGEGSRHGGADHQPEEWHRPVRPVWQPMLMPLQLWVPLREEPEDAAEVR